MTPLGESVEGRPISLLSIGRGPRKVFLWTQMHGDEPTHTAALLDLLSFLQKAPDHETATAILNRCQLDMILVLNPDGAERCTRRNAQGIDVNRDALHLQTPEGRILHDAVEQIQPEFAFNLHNQRPRTTVGDSRKVASYSLLVPPIDEAESETQTTKLAKKLAATIARAVNEHSPGGVSRYNADFMPRCFGEWVQQQGVATVTIEAGGWSTVDMQPLVQLHFYGLLAGLEAIAAERLHQADPREYDALPLTGDHDLFDILIRGANIFSGQQNEAFYADIGVNLRLNEKPGTIVDFGDLSVNEGKVLLDGTDLACLPGRIVWQPDLSPTNRLAADQIESLQANGVTTVLGQIDLSADEDLENFRQLKEESRWPLNLGFIGRLETWSDQVRDPLLEALSLGILGISAKNVPRDAKRYLDWFAVPSIEAGDLLTSSHRFCTLEECARHTHQLAAKLGLPQHGTVGLGKAADLILLQRNASRQATSFSWSDLQQVIVGGTVVWNRSGTTGQCPGVLLTRRQFPANSRF